MEKAIERRNKVYACYVKVEKWLKENTDGLFDKEQIYCVSTDVRNLCEWMLHVKPNGECYLCLSRTNYNVCENVTSKGVEKRESGWCEEKGAWNTGNSDAPYAYRGMEGTVLRWKEIKEQIQSRIDALKALDDFEV